MPQVRVTLYKDNVEKRMFEFNGEGTDYLNWFRQDRLLSDFYTDLSSTEPSNPGPSYFSIEGSVSLLLYSV